jgi:hypothetical protein
MKGRKCDYRAEIEERRRVFAGFLTVDAGRSRKLIATVELMPGWEANARLIAAAPELLEACIDMVSFLDAYPHHFPVDIGDAEQGLIEAIKKARGEE